MNNKNKIACLISILKARFFFQKTPLVISWHLVNRCNRRCKYCFRWDSASRELTTGEIFRIIDEVAQLRTKVIIFSGGEPLLRDDIGEIIKYSQQKGIFTGLTSNGSLVPQKIDRIRSLDVLKLSLDGPKEVHDFVRGEGSYDEVMNSIAVAKENKINIKLNTTLTKYNIDYIDSILRLAGELNIEVKFQPVSHVHSFGRDISFLFPDENKYKKAINLLICLKKKNPYIINSVSALKYLFDWPHVKKINCYAGKLICCIMANGDISRCSATRDNFNSHNCLDLTFSKAFNTLPEIIYCKGCWCTSTLELNCLLDFNIKTILNVRNYL